MNYPLFTAPEIYLKTRQGTVGFTYFKQIGERWALDRCVAMLSAVKSVCDAPCGYGTLFSYWSKKGFQVVGVDLSKPMVTEARDELSRVSLSGNVLYGDIFSLSGLLKERVDLVACVRFIYYFEKTRRVKLLKELAAASNHYVLVQYKTTGTYRGKVRSSEADRKGERQSKYFCSFEQIREELREAGLSNIRIVPISQFSDRVFVIGEKTCV